MTSFEGQTTFGAFELKVYYARMIEQGTLDFYVQTQRVDFAFMVASFVSSLDLAGVGIANVASSVARREDHRVRHCNAVGDAHGTGF